MIALGIEQGKDFIRIVGGDQIHALADGFVYTD